METRANYATIGLFTLAVVAMCFAFVYWLARYDESGARKPLRVLIPGSVAGLSTGSQVLFNGIKIGEVKSLRINRDNPSEVESIVTVDPSEPIKADTRVAVGVQGLTGLGYIEFQGGSADKPNILDQPGMPTMHATGSGLQDLIASAQQLVGKVNTAVDRVNGFIDKAEPSLNTSIKNVETFTGALAKNSEGVQDFMTNFGDLSKKIGSLSDNLQGMVTKADKIVSAIDPKAVTDVVDNARTTLANARDFMGSLNARKPDIDQIVTNARDISQRLAAASVRIDGLLGKADQFLGSEEGKGFFQEATAAARSIRKVAEAFEGKANQIADNLANFSGQGLRNVNGLVDQLRRSATKLDQTLNTVQSNPQGFIFGNPTVRDYNRR